MPSDLASSRDKANRVLGKIEAEIEELNRILELCLNTNRSNEAHGIGPLAERFRQCMTRVVGLLAEEVPPHQAQYYLRRINSFMEPAPDSKVAVLEAVLNVQEDLQSLMGSIVRHPERLLAG